MPSVDPLIDLKAWPGSGLPVAAEWNCTGFKIDWHANQIKAGHRFFPTFLDLGPDVPVNSRAVNVRLVPLADQFAYLSSIGAPLALRPNLNWTDTLWNNYIVSGALPQPVSPDFPLIYKKLAAPQKQPDGTFLPVGTIVSGGQPDPLATNAGWIEQGTHWGSNGWLKKLQEFHPNPSCVLFLDNNEGPKLDWRQLTTTSPKPPGTKVVPRAWLPADQMAFKSLRAVDWANGDPYAQLPDWVERLSGKYKALSGAFRDQLSPAWQSVWMTGSYKVVDDPNSFPDDVLAQIGPASQAWNYDCVSEKAYCNPDVGGSGASVAATSDFTATGHVINLAGAGDLWAFYRQKNPKLYVELFCTIGRGTIKGWAAGLHDPIDPEAWQGYIEWMLWSIHRPGMPVIVRDYRGARATPTDNILDPDGDTEDDSGGVPTVIPDGWDKLTKGDYATAASKAVDHISENPILRDCWLRGVPVPVTYPSEPSPYRAAVTKLDDKFVIQVWSPHNGYATPVTVAGITVPGAGYWLAVPPPSTGFLVTPLEVP